MSVYYSGQPEQFPPVRATGGNEMFYNLLIHMGLVLNFVTTVYCLYELMVSIPALRRQKAPVREDVRFHRFAVIIAARNEESVICNLIDSLHAQDYPRELLDVYVIADNCDDHTADAARRAGAAVYERFNRAEIGKGYVIRFALDKILEEKDVYDAFCVIDADNVADRNFIRSMNLALCDGSSVAQGYRDMKNPTDNWISGCHSLFYWMENRFYDHARSLMGLSATINGTGFMISRDYLRKYGFHMKTVTEDLELTMQCVINGHKVDWVPDAKVYDEQPLTVGQSMRQRTRWVNGFLQVFMKYFGPLCKTLVQKPDWVKVDMFVFFISLPMMFIGALAIVLFSILECIFQPTYACVNLIMLAGASVGVLWLIGYLSVALENKGTRRMMKAVLTFPIFNLMWLPIYCQCVFRRKVEWKPIIHVRNLSINEVEATQSK